MVKIIRAESEKTLMRKVKECFFSRNESSYALVMKEKNPLDSAFSVIHKVLRLGYGTVEVVDNIFRRLITTSNEDPGFKYGNRNT